MKVTFVSQIRIRLAVDQHAMDLVFVSKTRCVVALPASVAKQRVKYVMTIREMTATPRAVARIAEDFVYGHINHYNKFFCYKDV